MTSPQDYARLLDVLSGHLAVRPAEVGIASVEVDAARLGGTRATVQLSSSELAEVARGLLGWVDALTEIAVDAWRPADSGSVHLILTGRLADGLALRVYSGVDYDKTVFGADLQPDGRQSVALSMLRVWANGGAVAA